VPSAGASHKARRGKIKYPVGGRGSAGVNKVATGLMAIRSVGVSLAHILNGQDAMKLKHADPRLVWIASVLAAAVFVLYVAQI
jgi:hypothetical protein